MFIHTLARCVSYTRPCHCLTVKIGIYIFMEKVVLRSPVYVPTSEEMDTEHPSWLANLIEMYANNDTATDEFVWPYIPLKESTPAAFLEMLKPLLKSGVKRLQAGVQALATPLIH